MPQSIHDRAAELHNLAAHAHSAAAASHGQGSPTAHELSRQAHEYSRLAFEESRKAAEAQVESPAPPAARSRDCPLNDKTGGSRETTQPVLYSLYGFTAAPLSEKYAATGSFLSAFRPATTHSAFNSAPARLVWVCGSPKSGSTAASPSAS